MAPIFLGHARSNPAPSNPSGYPLGQYRGFLQTPARAKEFPQISLAPYPSKAYCKYGSDVRLVKEIEQLQIVDTVVGSPREPVISPVVVYSLPGQDWILGEPAVLINKSSASE
jgi:hypothetical protein